MGGGDLNSKKSWHPNTIKNQERVWKAEQAVAEEKKRMLELQRERAEERDRAELNDIMSKSTSATASDNRLAWMYDKPDKKVDQEAYLLGKTLDKNTDQTENVVQDPIPAVSRRVIGSSMLTTAGDAQVDMSRKIREDPLLLIKERERAARAALLNNPLQRRRLAQLLRKEQEQRKQTKVKKKSKKKDKDLDALLATKLNAFGAGKSIDIATLLDSDNSSSETEDEKPKKKKKKRDKSKKKKKRKQSSDSESDDIRRKSKESHHKGHKTSGYKYHNRHLNKHDNSDDERHLDNPAQNKSRDIKSGSDIRNNSELPRRGKRYIDTKDNTRKYRSDRKSPEADRRSRHFDQRGSKSNALSEQEKAARLAEMASAGVQREIERGVRVAGQRVADMSAEHRAPAPSGGRREARALPDSLEARIHSNRHYIQRDKRHMNENFARR